MARRSLVLSLIAAGCSVWAADAGRGGMLLEDAACLECHTVHAQGAGHEPSGVAPELGADLLRTYTAPALASAVWNHTPAMLAELSAQRLHRPALTAQDWEDVFAYLYSVQFLEFPAEIGRGKEMFQSKQCAGCHSLGTLALGTLAPGTVAPGKPPAGPGKAVAEWKPLEDPVALVYRMWSHAVPMDTAGREATWTSAGWTKVSGRDFMDLTAYVQQLQQAQRQTSFTLPDPAEGKPVFDEKCGGCHAGPLALETFLKNTTWLDIGASMWNHVTLMRRLPEISEPEMRKVLAYVWELQYRGPQGNREDGRAVFGAKGCTNCHDGRAIGKTVTPASLAAIGWGEGRRMHQGIEDQGIAWPQLTPQEITDIVAYLNGSAAK